MAIDGTWNLSMSTPMGQQTPTLKLSTDGGSLSGSMESPMGSVEFSDGTVDGDSMVFKIEMEAMGTKISIDCKATVDGDSISGEMNSPMGGSQFTGERG